MASKELVSAQTESDVENELEEFVEKKNPDDVVVEESPEGNTSVPVAKP